MRNQDPMASRERAFARMWSIVTLAHLAGNAHPGDIWPTPSWAGFALLISGLLATWTLLRPSRIVMGALAASIPVTALLEVPFLGNHWLLAAIISATYLVARDWETFENAARAGLLTFYAFAAFAKLNSGFLDPETSCGLFYANQMLTEFGLGMIAPNHPLAYGAAWGSALIELSVVPLMLWSKTRRLGLWIAIGFHGFLTLDLGQHFYDFTSVLFALFALFATDDFMESVDARFESAFGHRVVRVIVALAGVATTLGNVTLGTAGERKLLADITFLWWFPYLGLFWLETFRRHESARVKWQGRVLTVACVGVIFANGLTPYLELKTTYGWNMYSNLVVVEGDSNHLLVRRGFQARAGHHGLVDIVESDEPAIQAYATQKYRLPWPSFLRLAQQYPEASVRYVRLGREYEVTRVRDARELNETPPAWWRWFPLRSIHAENPQRCQSSALAGL